MHSAVEFCDSSFAIMVSKAPSGPSGSRELRSHHIVSTLFRSRAPNLTRMYSCMPAHARSGDALQFLRSHALQPAHDDSMTAFAEVCATACLGHAVRLTTHSPFSASLVSYAAICMHAHARAAAALQFLRSHAPRSKNTCMVCVLFITA